MKTGKRALPCNQRHGDRIPCRTRLEITDGSGRPLTLTAECTNIGLGGLRAVAAEGFSPGTKLHVALRLPSGRSFEAFGHVAWCQQTIRPTQLTTQGGRNDDAIFGIAFDQASPEALMPIARLFTARDREHLRARRIRRIHGLPLHA